MADSFDLDLQTVEREIERGDEGEEPQNRRIVLGVLDGTTDVDDWFETVQGGDVLVLAIEGDLSELAADLAPRVKERGGNLVHFRDFLIVTPAGVSVDADRL
ncbi:hypothetical protein BRC82_10120 [Halobacteriales archaeon QS_1_67_19]|nr:MAG: hypothetical protein BRC82_10120 [Halobacteriales archaeon QS_1_67_19]